MAPVFVRSMYDSPMFRLAAYLIRNAAFDVSVRLTAKGQVPITRLVESVARTLKVPAAVGVPVTAPVDAFRVSPAGRVPTIEKV